MRAPALLLLACIVGSLWVLAVLVVPASWGVHLSAFDALFVVLVGVILSWLEARE